MSNNETPTSKLWNEDVLLEGGVSYWLTQDLDKVRNGELKPRYRVALAKGGCTKMLKWKVKTASCDIFSVAAKTQREANLIVAEVYGSKMYSVSQMMC